MPTRCSRHAERRIGQRGVPRALLHLLLQHGDHEVDVGDGCVALSCSRDAVRDLPASLGERVGKLVAVLAGDRIVTVLHAAGPAGRAYRRGKH